MPLVGTLRYTVIVQSELTYARPCRLKLTTVVDVTSTEADGGSTGIDVRPQVVVISNFQMSGICQKGQSLRKASIYV